MAARSKGRLGLDFEQVVDSLKADIPNIFRKHPHWDLFANDFKVIDSKGARLEGLETIMSLWILLRRVREQFLVTDDIRVDPIVRSLDADPLLVARWKVQFGNVELEDTPVEISADSVFHFN